jgi:hypothetical protein
MAKMTSTLTEMEIEIWAYIYSALYGEPIIEGTQLPKYSDSLVKITTNYIIANHSEFPENVIDNLVRSIYLKDFNTN